MIINPRITSGIFSILNSERNTAGTDNQSSPSAELIADCFTTIFSVLKLIRFKIFLIIIQMPNNRIPFKTKFDCSASTYSFQFLNFPFSLSSTSLYSFAKSNVTLLLVHLIIFSSLPL